MNNSELVSRFITGKKQEGHSLNMKYDGDTIYSYGEHFPIARLNRENKTFTFNHTKYSSSTTKHQKLTYFMLKDAGYTEVETTIEQLPYNPGHRTAYRLP